MKIAMVSTYRTQCGVAKYVETLCDELSKNVELHIYVDRTGSATEIPKMNPNINIPFTRCYTRGDPFSEMIKKIKDFGPDKVHIQFESSIYHETYYKFTGKSFIVDFIRELQSKGIETIITFHNVMPYIETHRGQYTDRLITWYKHIAKNSKIVVCNKAVKGEFLQWNRDPKVDISVIPLGSTIFTPYSKEISAKKLKQNSEIIYVVQPGFYGADKGMVQVVKSFTEVLKKYPSAKLVFAGGLHPTAPYDWRTHTRACMKEIIKQKLTKSVMLLGRFLSEDDLNLWLGLADVVSLNYHGVSQMFSASASAHRVLCSERPIVMNTDDVRLSEFLPNIHCCKSGDKEYGKAILYCYENKKYAEEIIKGASDYAHETSFENIAKKHMEVYNG